MKSVAPISLNFFALRFPVEIFSQKILKESIQSQGKARTYY